MGWWRMHGYRLRLLIAGSFCLITGLAHPLAAADTRAYNLSYTVLGTASSIPEGQLNDEGYEFFATRLTAVDGFSVKKLPAPMPGQDWRTPPEGQTADQWISLVQVCFARRSDWLAFVFDGPDGAASFGVRRPALHIDRSGTYAFSMAPGHFQFNCNAGIELAVDFAMGMAARSAAADQRPRLQVVVEADADDDKDIEPDGMAGMMLDTTSLSMAERDLAGITALSFAAAGSLGWQPTSARADNRLKLSVSRQVMTYTVTADYVSGDTERHLTKTGMQAEYLYDNLLTLFRQLSLWDKSVSDFCLLDPKLSDLLICEEGVLVIVADDDLRGFSPSTGEKLWEHKKPTTYDVRYTTRPGKGGVPVVWRFDYANPIEMVTRTGELSPAKRAAAEVTYPWGTSTDYAAGRLAVVSKETLLTYEGEQAGWEYRASAPITAGPCLSSNIVLAGTGAGEMMALAWNSGDAEWRTPTAERLRGEITASDDFVFAGSFEGTLFAFARSDGKIAWRTKIGDLPSIPPQRVKDKLLVAGGNNIVYLLDPATGEKKAEQAWPAWLTGVAVSKNQEAVVCADQNGTVIFLDPDNLAVRRRVDLHERLLPGLLCVENLPHQWAAADDFGEVGTVAIVADRRGFIYLLPVEPESN